MATELLYLRDACLRDVTATVSAVDPEGRRVALDRTVFYPTGGGQPHDTGTLGGMAVVDVRKEGDTVWHTLASDDRLPAVGDHVQGVIDWERRHRLMRTHTALHVLCGVIWKEWGTAVTGGNMEPLSARMDFEFDPLPVGFAAHVERAVNEELDAARPIEVSFLPQRVALGDADLIRTKVNLIPGAVTEIRVVDIVGLDKQADGAPTWRGPTRSVASEWSRRSRRARATSASASRSSTPDRRATRARGSPYRSEVVEVVGVAVVDDAVAGGTPRAEVERGATGEVVAAARQSVGACGPRLQHGEGAGELASLGGQLVVVAHGPDRVRRADDEPLGLELAQPGGEEVRGDAGERGVEDDSPAAAADGVTTGDLIVSANGGDVRDADDLWSVLDGLGTADALELGLLRGAEELSLRVSFQPGGATTAERSP